MVKKIDGMGKKVQGLKCKKIEKNKRRTEGEQKENRRKEEERKNMTVKKKDGREKNEPEQGLR